jgi:hypothetical protein
MAWQLFIVYGDDLEQYKQTPNSLDHSRQREDPTDNHTIYFSSCRKSSVDLYGRGEAGKVYKTGFINSFSILGNDKMIWELCGNADFIYLSSAGF